MHVYILAMHLSIYTRQMQSIVWWAKAKCIVLQKLEIWHCKLVFNATLSSC